VTSVLAVMPMTTKIQAMWPEVALFAFTCVVMVVGLSKTYAIRRLCGPLSLIALGVALVLAVVTTPPGAFALANMPEYMKVVIAAVGVLLLLLMQGMSDREYEAAVAAGEPFDPLRSTRAEFYSFFLFSITGLMLCAGADDLIWLFLALELTSLPTYIMVAISTSRNRSMEAGVKYFFLGALGAATFLYGFVLLYGATGTTNLAEISRVLGQQMAEGAGVNPIAMAGLVLSVLGIAFKIAAVPMHFYTPDVYQGASASVSAMLAFVPKTAGFIALLLVVSTVGWSAATPSGHGQLPSPLHEVLWIMAVLTMTVGNVLAILQHSVKRVLAYSSIAHSGYMLVGVIAGPGPLGSGFASNGLAAVMFYLMAYGVMNVGAFAVLASLEKVGRDGQIEEVDSFDDLRGLCRSRPVLGYVMVFSALGLLGLPPTLGFFAKLPLFTSGISAGHLGLVIILGINSAIAAYYYLRLAATPWLESGEAPQRAGAGEVRLTPFGFRTLAGGLSAAGVVVLAIVPLTSFANRAAIYSGYRPGTLPMKAPAAAEQPAREAAAETVADRS
jgi:NADH-quinone oxidoreductase subunit N